MVALILCLLFGLQLMVFQKNQTKLSEFLLLGLSNLPETRLALLCSFLFLYLLTLTANFTLALSVCRDSHLQNPMYFLLCALGLSETFLSLAIVPKTLTDLTSHQNTSSISFSGCVAQMYFAAAFACTNCFLLAAMGYDRLIAVCDPLRYMTRMGGTMCLKLVMVSGLAGFCVAAGMASAVFRLPYCLSHNRVNHFYCDMLPLVELACGDSQDSQVALILLSFLVLGISLSLILLSYAYILETVLKMSGAVRRWRAFSTCGAHLTVVIIHFGCASFMYLRPKASYDLERDKMIAVSYVVVTPLLSPMVYSLRNREVHAALRKMLSCKRLAG